MRLIYFAPVYWKSYRQRPHFMIQYFLEQGGERVLWVDPYPSRFPRLSDWRRRRGGLHDQNTLADARVEVRSIEALPIEPLPGGAAVNYSLFWRKRLAQLQRFAHAGPCTVGVGRPSRFAALALELLPREGSFFDAMDDFPEFYDGLARRRMAAVEASICRGVQTILASSTYLETKFRRRGLGGKVLKVLNGCEPSPAADSAPRRPPRPVLGYVGTIGEWFDWELVASLGARLPGCDILLIGPVFTPARCKLPPNVSILPACDEREARSHLDAFCVGLIPFKIDALTRGVDPIKYYEYRSKGLPVLTTPFGEMARRKGTPGVFLLPREDPEPVVNQALAYREDPESLRTWRLQNSWRARFRAAGLFVADHSG